jgi:hypothetical protein
MQCALSQVSDESDAVFSIVIPSSIARNVNMGRVLVGTTHDTLVAGFIRNTGRAAIRIDAAFISGGTASVFAVSGGLPPVNVDRDTVHDMAFSFSPLSAGPFTAEIVIMTQVDTQRYNIYGEGVQPQIEVATRYVDFGVHPVGSVKDSVVSLMLRNLTAGPVNVRSIAQSGPDSVQFSIREGGVPFTLPPLGTHGMTLRFAPLRGGRSSGSITFEIEGASDAPQALLFGEGIAVTASVTLATDTITANIGDIVTIPIRLRDEEHLQLSGATELTTELRYRASVLVPIGATPRGRIEGDWRVLSLEGLPRLPLYDNVIAEYTFMAVLGTAETTPLLLQNSVAIGADVDIMEVPGYFMLGDICREGEVRLFDGEGKITLQQNNPNPFNSTTTISYETIERGPARLSVLNPEGRVLKVLFDADIQPGTYRFQFDAGDLASGTYIYQLQSGSLRVQRRMQLLK